LSHIRNNKGTMMLRTLARAVALSCGLSSGTALAKKPFKAKPVKPKKDPRFKDSKAARVKPRKAKKSARPAKSPKATKHVKHA